MSPAPALGLAGPRPAPKATEASAAGPSALLPVFAALPLEPVGGLGARLQLRDGRELVDFYGGHAVALLGYRHPRLLAALERQARELFFQTTATPLAVRERAARALADFAPQGLGHVFFVNSGAEANENALRLAFRARPGRTRVIAVEGSFHGRTAAAAAVTWGADTWYSFPAKPFAVSFVRRGDLAALGRELAQGDVAAMIVEPVQGMAGAVPLGKDFLAAAMARVRAAGGLMIFDEVQCGMGRTGAPFAAQRHGVVPDILTVAKGLAGGFPAGAMLVSEDLAAGVRPGDLGTTFGGGPLACALVEATIESIRDERILDNVALRSGELLEKAVGRGPVMAARGEGLLLGLILSRPAKQVQLELLERGFLAGTSADPRVLRLLPPLNIGADEVAGLLDALGSLEP